MARQQKKSPSKALVLYRGLVIVSLMIILAYGVYLYFFSSSSSPIAPPIASAATPSYHIYDTTLYPSTEEGTTQEILPNFPSLERKEGYYTFLVAATDEWGSNADTIMVVSFDTLSGQVGILSLPRDTLVVDSGQTLPKLNASYRGSEPLSNLSRVVAEMLGIPIDFQISVSLTAFQALVNAVGGIDFYVPCNMDYVDPTANPPLSIQYSQGWQFLNGQQALEVARFRQNNDGTGYTDIGRTQTQQNLLIAIGKKMLSWSSLTKLSDFAEIFDTYVSTNLELSHMLWFANQALTLDSQTAFTSATLPGDGTVSYMGYSWCYALEPTQSMTLINQLINPYTTELTLDMTNIVVP